MVPMFPLARLVVMFLLTGPIVGIGLAQGSAVSVERAPVYAGAILEGMGGTGWARDINASGDIVGYVTEPDSEVKLPALWRDGALELLTTPDNPGGVATAINDVSDIAGYLQMPEGDPRPVVWRDGVPSVLDTPAGVGYAYAINKAEQIVGEVKAADGIWQPALWDEGRLTLLATGGEWGGQARDINDSGQIAGTRLEADPGRKWDEDDPVRAVMWDAGELQVLGPLGSRAWGISALGNVVGTADDPAGTRSTDGAIVSRAVTWNDGEMTFVDAGEGMTESFGMAIDDGVGVAVSARSGEGPPHALLVTAGGPVPLEGLSDLSRPEAVNGYGIVVGSAWLDVEGSQAVRWIPMPAIGGLAATSDFAISWGDAGLAGARRWCLGERHRGEWHGSRLGRACSQQCGPAREVARRYPVPADAGGGWGVQ